MKLYVIRHGQTDYNAQRRFQGQADIPLNSHGEAQLRRSGILLTQLLCPAGIPNEEAVKIISSDLLRTRQSTDILCTELHRSGAKISGNVNYDSRLREFHCGLFENSTYDEFAFRHPEIAADYMENFNQDSYRTRYPGAGGESRLDVMERVGRVLTEIQQDTETCSCVWVVHGGVIDVLLELTHIQVPETKSDRISAGNGDLLLLTLSGKEKQISAESVRLGHTRTWRIDRHYKVGDTVAAKVIR
ncbi:MAG: histidine phosphatase family protein [Proteobacteria bacterium]|nr:histidine phosphatase family protein [Pseudomonadota bacterium]